MKKTIIMKEIFEAADLKELEGFTIQSVTNPNEDVIMLSLMNTEGKKQKFLYHLKKHIAAVFLTICKRVKLSLKYTISII